MGRVHFPAPLHRTPANIFKLVHYEVQTVGKRVVGIRLKCLLVNGSFTLTESDTSSYVFLLPVQESVSVSTAA